MAATSGLSVATPAGAAASLLFAGLLAVACVTDLRERRIPNRLVVVLLAGGLSYALITAPTLAALGRSLGALALGFAIWIPFYAFRMIGAGDVKLFAAASAWLAPVQVLQGAFWSAVVGGLLSLLWMMLEYGASQGVARATFMYLQPRVALRAARQSPGRVGGDTRRHLPYGFAMAIGLALTVWLSAGS